MRLPELLLTCSWLVADVAAAAADDEADGADEALYKQCNKIQLFSSTSYTLFRLLFASKQAAKKQTWKTDRVE